LQSPLPRRKFESMSLQPLSRGDCLALIGIVLGIVCAIGELTWWIRTLLVVIAFGLILFGAALSPARRGIKIITVILLFLMLLAVTWNPVSDGFHKSYPNITFRTPLLVDQKEVASGTAARPRLETESATPTLSVPPALIHNGPGGVVSGLKANQNIVSGPMILLKNEGKITDSEINNNSVYTESRTGAGTEQPKISPTSSSKHKKIKARYKRRRHGAA